jgi:hypothetical protein
MIVKTFPPSNQQMVDLLAQSGVTVERAHQTLSVLHIPDESVVEELSGANFRKYKKITTPNGKVFELDYFRNETQNRLLIVIPKDSRFTDYPIYPLVSIEAQKYLADCGCAVASEILGLPTSLTLDQPTGHVTCEGVILFQMRQVEQKRWLVILPRQYQDTFRLVLVTHNLHYKTVSAMFHLPEAALADMLAGIPVPREVAAKTLQRLSEYTRCPYSLENVRVAVRDD